jgi:lysozyme
MAAEEIAADFIRQREGCRLSAYQDETGVWTIGYGATGPDVTRDSVWTLDQAEQRLAGDLKRFSSGVQQLVSVPLSDRQLAALTSFTFNLGLSALAQSTLRIVVNQGDFLGAPGELIRWCNAGGHKSKGLLIRRLYEAALFLEGS